MKPVALTVRVLQLLVAAVIACAAPVHAQENRKVDSERFLYTLVDEIFGRAADVGFSHLSAREQTFILIWSLEGEVNNGGFDQFFFNSSGDHALATPGALRAIGAEKTARLVDEAISVFGSEGPSENSARRQQQLWSLSKQQQKRLSDLDKSFYTYPDNLTELLARYMRSTK